MKLFFTISLLVSVLHTANAQSGMQKEMEEAFKELNREFKSIYRELDDVISDGQDLMKKLDFEALDNGWIRVDGDSLDVSMPFHFLADQLQNLPPSIRPDDYIENLHEIAPKMPHILDKSVDMWRTLDLRDIMKKHEEFDLDKLPKPTSPKVPSKGKEIKM